MLACAKWPTRPLAHCRRSRRAPVALRAASAGSRGGAQQERALRFAVLGGGLAGVATAWELLAQSRKLEHSRVEVHLFEAHSIAAGGSGAAAGLLHPCSPRGKVLWKGQEALAAALDLVEVAASTGEGEGTHTPFTWRHGLLRPAADAKQAAQFLKQQRQLLSLGQEERREAGGVEEHPARMVSGEQMQELVPGLSVPLMRGGCAAQQAEQPQHNSSSSSSSNKGSRSRDRRKGKRSNHSAGSPHTAAHTDTSQGSELAQIASIAGFYVPRGMVLNVPAYLRRLWHACERAVAERADGSAAVFHELQVRSVSDLQRQHGPFDAVVVATGAAVGALEDGPFSRLPLQLCQGYTLAMVPGPSAAAYPPTAPSLLGQPYMAAQGQELVVGATQHSGLTPQEALSMCSANQRIAYRVQADPADGAHCSSSAAQTSQAVGGSGCAGMQPPVAAATQELLQGAVQLWPALGGWRVKEVRSGVRAIPPRLPTGSVPMLGLLEQRANEFHCKGGEQTSYAESSVCTWLFVGLGARGLLYHALFARQLAAAILAQDEQLLEPETRAWKLQQTGTQGS